MNNIKKKLFTSLAILMLTVSCGDKNPFALKTDGIRTVESLNYSADPEGEVVNFNVNDGSTTVMLGKFLPDNAEYKFMFLLKNGAWIGTNAPFKLGDTLSLGEVCVKIVKTESKNGNINATTATGKTKK